MRAGSFGLRRGSGQRRRAGPMLGVFSSLRQSRARFRVSRPNQRWRPFDLPGSASALPAIRQNSRAAAKLRNHASRLSQALVARHSAGEAPFPNRLSFQLSPTVCAERSSRPNYPGQSKTKVESWSQRAEPQAPHPGLDVPPLVVCCPGLQK